MSTVESAENALPLSKCCTSVVPKKRKRHIEMKHRNTFMRSKFRRQPQNMPSDIYIDVDQTSADDVDSSNDKGSSESPDNQRLVLMV